MASSHASSLARSEGLRRGLPLGGLVLLALALGAAALPSWLVFLATVAFAKGLVVLGLMVLWRAGLISFGQALYYAVGAYTVALVSRATGLTDAVLLVALGGVVAAVVAFLVGFLLARYREIFFAMLSLALSMILYGVLVKTEALGSTDGFNVSAATFLGYVPRGGMQVLALFWFTLAVAAAAAVAIAAYLRTVAGSLAVPLRDNEIRVEYLGVSATRLVHLKLIIAGLLAGLGGALTALVVAHVDPDMAYWTTSGGFVFVAILAGPSSVVATFVGALLFELLRSIAIAVLPGFWQVILGSALLLTILFLPEGIGSLAARVRRRPAGSVP